MINSIEQRYMKIAIVIFHDIFASNGTTVRVHRLLQLLHDKFKFTIINSSEKGIKKLKGMDDVNVISIGTWPRRYRSIPFPLKLIRIFIWNLGLLLILLKGRYDTIFCAYDLLGFPSIYLVSKIRKYKIVYEAHAIFTKDLEEAGHSGVMLQLDRALEKFVAKHSDFIIALSSNTMDFYKEYNPNIALIPVFLDTDIFRAEIRPKASEKRLIGLIGPFVHEDERQKYCLDFLYKEIGNFDSRISFLLIGRCDDKIQHDRIKYTDYLDSQKDYVECLSSLDAVFVPEAIATYGPKNKVIEPMSCSMPVFATPKAMVALFGIEPGRDILIFNENEIVANINRLIFDRSKMDEIGKNARVAIERYYSKKSNGENLAGILMSLK